MKKRTTLKEVIELYYRMFIDMTLKSTRKDFLTDIFYVDLINDYGTEKQKELYERRLKEVN